MKIKLGKLSLEELLQAAKGEFEVDITDELKKALASDTEARALGVLTKSQAPDGDSRIDAALAEFKAEIAALKAAVTTAATPLKTDDTVLKAIEALRTELATLKADVTKLADQASQAVATAEAVRGEIAKRPEGVGGAITPEMTAFLNQQSQVARKAASPWAFDSVEA